MLEVYVFMDSETQWNYTVNNQVQGPHDAPLNNLAEATAAIHLDMSKRKGVGFTINNGCTYAIVRPRFGTNHPAGAYIPAEPNYDLDGQLYDLLALILLPEDTPPDVY